MNPSPPESHLLEIYCSAVVAAVAVGVVIEYGVAVAAVDLMWVVN